MGKREAAAARARSWVDEQEDTDSRRFSMRPCAGALENVGAVGLGKQGGGGR